MVKDAEANKEADKKKRDGVDARNQADSIVFSTEKSLKEHGDKVSAEEKKAIENGIADLKKSLEGTDIEDIKKKRESVDARNQGETLIHSTEKNLKEHGSKVSEQDKKTIEDSLSHLRNALKGTDIEEIKKKTQDLVQSSMKLGEAIYKSQQEAKPSPDNKDDPKNKEEKKDDNVVDADFEEVKDENKEKSA